MATTLVSWSAKLAQMVAPPRFAVTQLKRGSTLGAPGDVTQQRRVLQATLGLLAQDAPLEMVRLDETVE